MAKRLEERLTHSKAYINVFGKRDLTVNEINELYNFNDVFGYTPDRITFLVECISQQIANWVLHWETLRKCPPGSLEYFCVRYGKEQGTIKYKTLNKKKTTGFDHSSETQRKKALKSAALSKGNKEWSHRGIGFWLKRGLSEEAAKLKVAKIQKTNTLDAYVSQYGIDQGTKKFNERRASWVKRMSDPGIGKKRSLGLARYIERYGEEDGKKAYYNMRIERNTKCSIGKASAESLLCFKPILDICDRNNLTYYVGIPGNKEWFIKDHDSNQMFFYDLTIPSLSLIAEFHGEAFHPNPTWNKQRLLEWKQLFTNKSAKDILLATKIKNEVAMRKGWRVIEVFSSDPEQSLSEIISLMFQAGYC
jgi:hypothetical protein